MDPIAPNTLKVPLWQRVGLAAIILAAIFAIFQAAQGAKPKPPEPKSA
jgi:hypothetical protein